MIIKMMNKNHNLLPSVNVIINYWITEHYITINLQRIIELKILSLKNIFLDYLKYFLIVVCILTRRSDLKLYLQKFAS